MTKKHTQGPYATERVGTSKVLIVKAVNGGVPLCRMYAGRNEEADANLFAAAPELLEALEAALCWLPPFYEQTAVDNGGIGNSVLARRIDEARTAIAKAKGEG